MTALMRWVLTLGAGGATSNAAQMLDARRQAEASVDALASRLAEKVRTAA